MTPTLLEETLLSTLKYTAKILNSPIPAPRIFLINKKGNAINGDIPLSKRIPINLENELVETKKKFLVGGVP